MTPARIRLTASAVLGASLALAFTPQPLTAQVLENTVIVGTTAYASQKGTSGLFFVTLPTSKSPGGKIQPFLGKLPPQLTVGPGKEGGAWSVLRRPSDGTIFVGDAAGQGGVAHVHILKMAGPRVLSFRSVRLGAAPLNIIRQTVSGLALLPDGRVLFATDPNLAAAPMSGSPLAILDDRTIPPTVTPIKLSVGLAQPAVQGLALSPDGRTAYLVVSAWAGKLYPSELYAIDLPGKAATPVTPRLLHTWLNRFVSKITVDRNGVLYTTAGDPMGTPPVPGTIEEIRIVNNKAVVKSTTVSSNVACIGPALERATGKFVFVSAYHSGMSKNKSVLMSDRSGNLSVLTGPPVGGWGMPFSIDILNSFETYGLGTKKANSYAFVDFPNPGGLPEVGNLKFSMTVESTPGQPLASLMVLGASKIKAQVLGVTLLVSPLIVLPMAWNHGQATVPLPIPNNPGLQGMGLLAQSFHFEPALASSNGLRIDIQ